VCACACACSSVYVCVYRPICEYVCVCGGGTTLKHADDDYDDKQCVCGHVYVYVQVCVCPCSSVYVCVEDHG
jgi:hypothetical protein